MLKVECMKLQLLRIREYLKNSIQKYQKLMYQVWKNCQKLSPHKTWKVLLYQTSFPGYLLSSDIFIYKNVSTFGFNFPLTDMGMVRDAADYYS